ncbi:MAG: hypothetical protein JSV24_07875 [Bacteroidales bacterium]|nr:MAG: hypothetical protein JSV24_07875 [Bacteroidales bacterium]
MVVKGILALTGADRVTDAWRMFVSADDQIGLKGNPVAGKTLPASHEIVRKIIEQLTASGIPKRNIIIWDRREHQLHETGYSEEDYPGIGSKN